jgi:hypothetical protein
MQALYQKMEQGMDCIRISDESADDTLSMYDNSLCLPPSASFKFRWSSPGPIDGSVQGRDSPILLIS